METMRQDNDISSHQLCGQQGGGTSTQRERECERKCVMIVDHISLSIYYLGAYI